MLDLCRKAPYDSYKPYDKIQHIDAKPLHSCTGYAAKASATSFDIIAKQSVTLHKANTAI